jgi:hypothetical protein
VIPSRADWAQALTESAEKITISAKDRLSKRRFMVTPSCGHSRQMGVIIAHFVRAMG